jgi:hypothetical protein
MNQKTQLFAISLIIAMLNIFIQQIILPSLLSYDSIITALNNQAMVDSVAQIYAVGLGIILLSFSILSFVFRAKTDIQKPFALIVAFLITWLATTTLFWLFIAIAYPDFVTINGTYSDVINSILGSPVTITIIGGSPNVPWVASTLLVAILYPVFQLTNIETIVHHIIPGVSA